MTTVARFIGYLLGCDCDCTKANEANCFEGTHVNRVVVLVMNDSGYPKECFQNDFLQNEWING